MAKANAGIDEIWLQKVAVPAQVLVLFSRQLATMQASGVPIHRALETLGNQEEFPDFGVVLEEVTECVHGGGRFSQALSRFPRVFPRIFVTMVQIGEETGSLENSLERVANWLQRDDQVVQQLRAALTYPAFVLGVSVLLTLGLFYTVLPNFLNIFLEMHMQLPLLTRMVMAITQAVRNPLVWAVALVVFGLGYRALQASLATPTGAARLFRLAASTPFLGGMLVYGTASRYCAASEALLSSGMDLPRALRLAARASGNPLLDQDSQKLVDAVINGEQVSTHMALHPELYLPLLANIVATGEEASRLPEMFGRAAALFDDEMSHRVNTLSGALEPILVSGVALVLGTLVLAIFLPMYSYLTQLN